MTRLLVVHPNPMVVWDRAAALELADYEVETCTGPAHADCPIMADQPCPLLDRADALIYDTSLGSTQEMRFLISHLRDTYADLPLIVFGEGEVDLSGADENRIWRVPSVQTVAQLTSVVEEALTEQGMAV
jgi:hypothetical protein